MSAPPTTAPVAVSDAAFPALHVRPPRGWVNDPNGPVRWKGRYHLFFQHNPDSHLHGDICWGHASSADLATWRDEPVALRPTPAGPDAGGCWSGCIVDDDGIATAVYTGIESGPDSASICLAYAEDDDLRTWRKHPAPVAVPPPGLDLDGYRDPFVFTYRGSRYALVGAGESRGGSPVVLLYACDDLRDWTYLGPFLDGSDPVVAEYAAADIWECPQLAEIDGRWVLIVSLWTGDTLGRVAYLSGDIVEDGGIPRLKPVDGGLVDAGHDFYAPAVLATPDRVLLWGWTWEDRPASETESAGWAGALTLARQLTLSSGRLVAAPVAEIERLRSVRTVGTTLRPSVGGVTLPGGPIEIDATMSTHGTGPVSLTVAAGKSRLRLTLGSGEARLESPVHTPERVDWPARGAYAGDAGTVRIVIDGSVVEVYVADGPVFTERVYAAADAVWTLALEGPATASADVEVWRLAAS